MFENIYNNDIAMDKVAILSPVITLLFVWQPFVFEGFLMVAWTLLALSMSPSCGCSCAHMNIMDYPDIGNPPPIEIYMLLHSVLVQSAVLLMIAAYAINIKSLVIISHVMILVANDNIRFGN